MSGAIVLYNEEVSPGYRRLGLEWKCRGVRPGHFVMVKVGGGSVGGGSVGGGSGPLLRRPFSVYDVFDAVGSSSFSAGGIELLYKVVGEGTAIMGAWEKGEQVDVIGPLGTPFPAVKKSKKPILVAGGIGIASFRLLGRAVGGLTMYYGARSKDDASLAWGMRGTGTKIEVATEDGTVGKKGLVTDLLGGVVNESTLIYVCGPTAMLKAVALLARARGARCYVSMERTMACGVGACLGCAVPAAAGGYKMTCSEGPVFESGELAWEKI